MKIPLTGACNFDIGQSSSHSESLMISANEDFVAFCVLWRLHIIGNSGTYWLASHSIEKYIKARLIQIDPKVDIKKYGHNLILLWKALCEIDSFTDIANPLIYDNFIKDTNNINMEVRYSESGSIISTQFFYLYCLLCTALRFRLLDYLPGRSKDNFGLGKIGFEEIPPERCDDNRLTAKELVFNCLDNMLNKNLAWSYLGKLEVVPPSTEFIRLRQIA